METQKLTDIVLNTIKSAKCIAQGKYSIWGADKLKAGGYVNELKNYYSLPENKEIYLRDFKEHLIYCYDMDFELTYAGSLGEYNWLKKIGIGAGIVGISGGLVLGVFVEPLLGMSLACGLLAYVGSTVKYCRSMKKKLESARKEFDSDLIIKNSLEKIGLNELDSVLQENELFIKECLDYEENE